MRICACVFLRRVRRCLLLVALVLRAACTGYAMRGASDAYSGALQTRPDDVVAFAQRLYVTATPCTRVALSLLLFLFLLHTIRVVLIVPRSYVRHYLCDWSDYARSLRVLMASLRLELSDDNTATTPSVQVRLTVCWCAI